MTLRQPAFSLPLMMVLAALASAQSHPDQPDGITFANHTASLHVSGPRALSEALYQLSRAFHWRIGFEEARLQFPGDLVDMTSPNYTPKSKDDRAYFPRGGPLDLQFPVSQGNRQPADPAAVIQNLIAEYQAKGYPGRYAFSLSPETQVFIHVFPTASANEKGILQSAVAITSLRVNIAVHDNDNLIQSLQGVLTELAARSAKQVLIGGIATPGLNLPAPRPAAAEESAALYLNECASVLGADSWEMLFEPSDKFYIFNFRYH